MERRRSSTVRFRSKLSVFSIAGTENEFDLTAETAGEEISDGPKPWWVVVAENIYFRQLFRAVSVVNLIVLAFSIPFYNLNELNDSEQSRTTVSIQFIIITILDFILACIYTFHLVIRVSYYLRSRINQSHVISNRDCGSYAASYRTLIVFLLTISMWYSVGIGIYRSIDNFISNWWYVGFTPRAILAVFPVLNLSLRVESSALHKLSRLLKWKQLAMVTAFYFIFVFIFALMGVHVIGGLEYVCMYRTMDEYGDYSVAPAIPITHCNPSVPHFCDIDDENNTNTGLVCLEFPPHDSDKLFFNYRSYVYYGQYRVILDALFAVYEVSTLELWNFMLYTAIEGRATSAIPILFYTIIVLFLVFFLQQSIFLVVIIESLSDLRNRSFFSFNDKTLPQKGQNKPTTVFTLQEGELKLATMNDDGSSTFMDKYSEFLVKFEKVFLVLVTVDAMVTATKHADMEYPFKLILQIWQPVASVLFLVEISFIFFFHIYHGQFRLFCRRPYYICLTVLAVGGVIASLPVKIVDFHIYDPSVPGNILAIFQALRFPRLLRLSQSLMDFTLKITSRSILFLSTITIIAICWLSVFNAQLFGYNYDFNEECKVASGEHFGTFVTAFESTFQIVLNEAWTDITSEVMCRSSYWFITNLYFIIIHLFSSLIFLNFFGAVILDNLEYDEVQKKTKLEKIKNKEIDFDEKYHYKLEILKKLGNERKKLKPPSGLVGDDPKLDELEVRKFFDEANTSNLVEEPLEEFSFNIPRSNTTTFKKSHQPTKIRQLSLVTSDDNDLLPSSETTPEFHRIYGSIALILNYINLWRKYNEDEKSKDPRSSHIHYLFGDSRYDSNPVNRGYESLKERYRFFDMALFCMSPEHRFRRFCTILLTAQAEAPHYLPIHGKRRVLQIFKNRIFFFLRWIVSRLPYSVWLLFLSNVVILVIQIIELTSESYHAQHTYTTLMEVFYLFIMFTWLILRIMSKGCFLNPHAAINSVWDVIDWILVLDSALLFGLSPIWGKDNFSWISFPIKIHFLAIQYRILYYIRCLRPLHFISIINALRAVVREIWEGWRNHVKASILLIGFMFMFASLGVQLFTGTGDDNPIAFCNDPRISTMEDCNGTFTIKIDTSREFLPLNDSLIPDVEMLVSRVWYPQARDYPFSNVLYAFVTLFELLTLEGWPEVRNILAKRDKAANIYMHIYIHTFVFFAVNIGLQLFLGIVVNNFNEHKPGHTFLLSVEQKRWAELMQRISLQRPDKSPPKPRGNKLRLKLYHLLIHWFTQLVSTIVITLSIFTLVVPWNEKVLDREVVRSLLGLSISLNMYTVLQMFLKLLAFGPSHYFQSRRNVFDFLLSFATIAYAIFGIFALCNPAEHLYQAVSYYALFLGIAKLITVMVKYTPMLNLLLTVLSTLLRSTTLIIVLGVIALCYCMLGVALFGNLRDGEAIDYYLVNFRGSTTALGAVLRSFTGEDWYQIMWDTTVSPPYCDDTELKNCGNIYIAIFYFSSFTFIVPFILLNVFIAVLLENFSIFYNDEDTNLDNVAMKDFKYKWRIFDFHTRGHIPIKRVKLLMRSLECQSYYTWLPGGELGEPKERVLHNLTDDPLLLWEMEEELRQEALLFVQKPQEHHQSLSATDLDSVTQSSSEIHVEFLNVLRMLAYRCEDIEKRLEPQELFTRKELEQTLQLDVAEKCILKWLQNRVKPIIQKQREAAKAAAAATNDDSTVQQQSLKDKRQQLLSMRNVQSQFLGIDSWGSRRFSIDTEDEDLEASLKRRRSLSQFACSNSEERIDYTGLNETTDELLASRSYNKMKQRYNQTSNTNSNRAKEWLQMQVNWTKKVKTDPNYFDDRL